MIAADTGADPERALLLASGLTGLAETSARWWLPRKGTVSRDEAVALHVGAGLARHLRLPAGRRRAPAALTGAFAVGAPARTGSAPAALD